MTVSKLHSSSVLSLVEVIRLIWIESIVCHFAVLKISLSFFPSLIRLCCGVRNMCGTNCVSHAGRGMTKMLHFSLFMVFTTLSSFLLMDGLLSAI